MPATAPPIKSGPFLRYERVDAEQQLWIGSAMIVLPTGSVKPTLVVTGGPAPLSFPGHQLDIWNADTFWRFDIQVPVAPAHDTRFQYRIMDAGMAVALVDGQNVGEWAFWVAAASEANWRWAFTSCNGFSISIPQHQRDKMGGVGAMWKDVLRRHEQAPFHAMVGGGDQIYCDAVWQLDRLKSWLALKGKENRNTAPWTPDLEMDLNNFYFNTYVEHFLEPTMRSAMAQLPSVNMLDDHDIWDGAGSYPTYLETSVTFVNMRRIAYRYYLLFQHHTTIALAVKDKFIGVERGAYSLVRQLGATTALICLDARSERTRDQVASPKTYDEVFAALKQSMPTTTKHVVVVTGVPLIYPRMVVAENLLHSVGRFKHAINKGFNKISVGMHKVVHKVFGDKTAGRFSIHVRDMKKALGKSGMMKSVLNHFGEPELADDLVDHWTNASHEAERTKFIMRLQDLSQSEKVRVTFIAGDVHCGGFGRFAAKGIDGPADHRLMYQVISSAIVNIPPPKAVLSSLHKSAKEIAFNSDTKEEMLNVFAADVNGKKLADKKLIGRRNWCMVTADSAASGSLVFSLQVENAVWSDPSKSYPVTVPAMA